MTGSVKMVDAAVQTTNPFALVDTAVRTMTAFDAAMVAHDDLSGLLVHINKKKWYRLDRVWSPALKDSGVQSRIMESIKGALETRCQDMYIQPIVPEYFSTNCKALYTKLQQASFKESVMREASDLFYRENFEKKLDGNPDLIGFENGVYDLEAGRFRAAKSTDMATMSTGYAYADVPDTSPEIAEIEAFLAQLMPSRDVREYFLSRVAACLSGRNKDEILVLVGEGSNGKSMAIQLLQQALGEYAGVLHNSALTQKKDGYAVPEIARLKGRRVTVTRPHDGERLDIAVVSGYRGVIRARPLYGEPFEFQRQFSMIVHCNTLPMVSLNDEAWRRIKVVKFGSTFTSDPDPEDPSHFPIYPRIGDKFPRWRTAFMSMLLRRYADDKYRTMDVPIEVTRASERYLTDMNMYALFVHQTFGMDPMGQVKLAELHAAFLSWAKDRLMPMDMQSLSAQGVADRVAAFMGNMKASCGRQFFQGWTARHEVGGY